ncbi:MAG: hypothetical protein WC815_00565 [Vicinamibacterales bacterium]|jgi:hypothetical protein
MRLLLLTVAVALCGGLVSAQEKPVPKDSTRLSIPGCAYDRLFIVDISPDNEMPRTDMKPGRRLRLSGPKKLLEEIKARGRDMVEITGLVRKTDLIEQGVGLAGGRIRIMPGRSPVGSTAGRDSGVSQAVIDVESWRLLNATCPSR